MSSGQQPCEAQIWFEEDCSEELLVTPMGAGLCRLEESFVFCEARYHDIIATELRPDGTLHFLRVVTPSELKTQSWIVSQTQRESPALFAILDKVITAGGHWEGVMGGILFVHLPAGFEDLFAELKNLFSLPEVIPGEVP